MLKQFGVPLEGLVLKIVNRGAPPLGGGEIILGVPIVPTSLTVSLDKYISCVVVNHASYLLIYKKTKTCRQPIGLMKEWSRALEG